MPTSVRGKYHFSIVGLGRSLNLTAMNALDEIDETYLVTTLDVPALHQSKQIIQTLTSVGYGRERLRLVLNRMPQRVGVPPRWLGKTTAPPVIARVPNDL